MDKLDWNNNDNTKQSCNYKIKNEWPPGNKCKQNKFIHQTNISMKEINTNEKEFISITSLNWKFRYYNLLQLFKNQH